MRFPSHSVIATYLAAMAIAVPLVAYGFGLRQGSYPGAGDALIVGAVALVVLSTVALIASAVRQPSLSADPLAIAGNAPIGPVQAGNGGIALATVGDGNLVVAGDVHGPINYLSTPTTIAATNPDLPELDLDYISGIYRDHTAIQASKLIEAYLGKITRISGSVNDVEHGSSGLRVTLNLKTTGDRSYIVFLAFQPRWNDRIAILRRNERLTARGRIEALKEHWMTLTECELID